MGLIRARISLANPKDPGLSPFETDALVDTGALHLCIPQHIAVQLQLQEIYKREVTTADGRRTLCPYVGPVQVTFANRGCFTGALVLGDEVLLGAVPMEDMDLVISPARRRLKSIPIVQTSPVRWPKACIRASASHSEGDTARVGDGVQRWLGLPSRPSHDIALTNNSAVARFSARGTLCSPQIRRMGPMSGSWAPGAGGQRGE